VRNCGFSVAFMLLRYSGWRQDH